MFLVPLYLIAKKRQASKMAEKQEGGEEVGEDGLPSYTKYQTGNGEYRLGDTLRYRMNQVIGGVSEKDQVAYTKLFANQIRDYPGSIGAMFTAKTQSKRMSLNDLRRVLSKAENDYARANNTKVAGKREMVVHLRLGDKFNFDGNKPGNKRAAEAEAYFHIPPINSYYQLRNLVNKYKIQKISFFVGMGIKRYETLSNREKTRDYVEQLKQAMETWFGITPVVNSTVSPDADYLYMQRAPLLVCGTGWFARGACLSKNSTQTVVLFGTNQLRELKMYLPPSNGPKFIELKMKSS